MTDPRHDQFVPTDKETPMHYSTGQFVRSNNKMVAGICQSIADRGGWDVNIVRLIVALGMVLTSGTVLIAYLVAWAVIPAANANSTLLNDAINEGKKFVEDNKAKRTEPPTQPQPGPAPQTPGARPEDPMNLYQD